MVRGYFKCTKFPCKFILGKNLSVAALFEYCFQEHKQLANINSWLCRPYLHSNNWLKAILKKPRFRLILGGKTCETHEWRKTMNTKKPLRSQHNRSKDNTRKQRKTSQVFILLHEKLLQFDWLRAVVFQLNLKYLNVKIANLLRVVV